ncbi:hypothetical protein [Streptomyces formicae]|uniref:Uncharacterized protein n=1 Tax=Streptomyces formicae TaxID=1616117 RepID=A0A291QAF1_9ACTN|nr:hypothetical protein [Streptomyces formicae]ATL28477.1 hypothetical protein KY5_3459c [Streptomyces formicae]
MSARAECAEERRAREAYGALLRHFDECEPCSVENYCDTGTRLRRAHRATREALTHAAHPGLDSVPLVWGTCGNA